MSTSRTEGSRFPFFGILGLIFITLKLTGVINWSWWWVLAPLWAPLGIAVIAAVVIVFAARKVKAKAKAKDPYAYLFTDPSFKSAN